MDAIVTAGGIPLPQDPLYPATQGQSKAMLDIAGKPMIQWVLNALSAAKTVDAVVIVGLTGKSGLECTKKMYFVSNQGKMVANLQAGARKVQEINPQASHVLLVSSDIPGITGEMVDWVIREGKPRDDDVVTTLISRVDVKNQLPERKFSWIRLLDGDFLSGALNTCCLDLLLDLENKDWVKFVQGRNNPAILAGKLGLATYFQYIFGRLGMEQVVRRVDEHLGLRIRILGCPYIEVGMRVDGLQMLECFNVKFKKQLKKALRTHATMSLKGKGEKEAVIANEATAKTTQEHHPQRGKVGVKSSK